MTTTLEELKALTKEVELFTEENIGWDATPTVFSIKDGSIKSIVALAGQGKSFDLLASMARDQKGLELLGDFDAFILLSEAWTYPKDIDQSVVDLEAMWGVIPPSEHPRKVEVRTMLAMSREGHALGVNRLRGDEPAESDRVEGAAVDTLKEAFKEVWGE